jgi:hypothetical protein
VQPTLANHWSIRQCHRASEFRCLIEMEEWVLPGKAVAAANMPNPWGVFVRIWRKRNLHS